MERFSVWYRCKPHAGGFVNVTDDHKLVAWYSGEDEILATAAVNVTRGGWRNEVCFFRRRVCSADQCPLSYRKYTTYMSDKPQAHDEVQRLQ